MGNTIIKINCLDQRLILSSTPLIASGGMNENIAEFDFCPLWDGFAKTAIFYRDETEKYYAIVNSENKCVIPWEVLQSDGKVFFGVYGVKGDVRRTTEIIGYKIKLGAFDEKLKPSEPTPDIYSQYVNRIIEVENRVTPIEEFTIKPTPFELIGNPVQMQNFEGMPLRVVTAFEPKQEGSGDPYPAGGGKNLFQLNVDGVYTKEGVTFTPDNASGIVKLSGTASARSTLRFGKFTANTDADIILNGAEGGRSSTYELCLCDATGNSVLLRSCGGDSAAYKLTNGATYLLYLFVYSGAVCDGAVISPMIRLASIADATFAPYENIRPISGYDVLGLTRAGKNLLPVSDKTSTTSGGIAWTNNRDGSWTANGTATANSYAGGLNMVSLGVLPAGEYTASMNPSTMASQIRMRIGNLTNGNSAEVTTSPTSGAATFTADGISEYCAAIYVASGIAVSNVTAHFQVELGSTATEYEPYQADTYTAQIGQTVYGGRMDWTKGEMVDDTDLLDLGDYSWFMQYDGVFRTNSYFEGTYANEMVLCSNYKSYGLNLSDIINNNNSVCMIGGYIWVNDKRFADAESLRAALVGVKMTARRVTPRKIQLTPNDIAALDGENNIFGDGEITVSGRKDILWLTSGLIERIKTLEAAVVSLGGNV